MKGVPMILVFQLQFRPLNPQATSRRKLLIIIDDHCAVVNVLLCDGKLDFFFKILILEFSIFSKNFDLEKII